MSKSATAGFSKWSFAMPVVLLLAGVALLTARGPMPLPHLHGVLTAATTKGGCTANGGGETLIFNPSAFGNSDVSATYTDEWQPKCYVWLRDGVPIDENDTPTATFDGKNYNLTVHKTYTDWDHSLSLFFVDGDHGGDWQLYTWKAATGSAHHGNCFANNAREDLLFNPSAFGTNPATIQYMDEWAAACYVWMLDGVPVQENDAPVSTKNGNTYTVNLSFPFNDWGNHELSVFIVDGDHGGDWDLYTWENTNCAYPPTAPMITASKGSPDSAGNYQVTGTLTKNGCPIAGQTLTLTPKVGGTKTSNKTSAAGAFAFPKVPGTAFPAQVSYTYTDSSGTHTVSVTVS